MDSKDRFSWTFSVPLPTRWFWLIGALPVALAAAWLSHSQLYEFDSAMLTRAGREILAGQGVQTVESWSHSALGHSWYNFQWLSAVLLAVVSRVGHGYQLYPLLRSLVVLVVFLLFFVRLRQQGIRGVPGWAAGALLAFAIYDAAAWRLQLRGELFTYPVFLCLLLVLESSASVLRRCALALALLLLWANLHGGTAVVGVSIYCAWALFAPAPEGNGLAGRLLLCALGVATWFLTPIGYHVLDPFLRLGPGYDWILLHSEDNKPVLFSMFLPSNPLAVPHWIWGVFSAAAPVIAWFRARDRREGRAFIMIALAGLTALTLLRFRANLYQLLFIAPVLADPLRELFARRTQEGRGVLAVLTVAGLTAWGASIHSNSLPNGEGLLSVGFPVETVRFLKSWKPQPNLDNGRAYGWGSYLIEALPEYKVSLDAREELFTDQWRELFAITSRETLKAYLARHQINILLLPRPPWATIETFNFPPEWLDPSEWALVFFENNATLYVRRIPEHQQLIKQNEYQIVRPGIRIDEAWRLDGAELDRYEVELDRCLGLDARNWFCLVSKAEVLDRRGRRGEANHLRMVADKLVSEEHLN